MDWCHNDTTSTGGVDSSHSTACCCMLSYPWWSLALLGRGNEGNMLFLYSCAIIMECLILVHICVLGNIHKKQCTILKTTIINIILLVPISCVVDRCLKNFCWMLIGLWMLACGCGCHVHLSFSSFFIATVQCALDARLTPMEITFGRMLIVIVTVQSCCICVYAHAHTHTTSQQNLRHSF
jgi:hypothetical protein